MQLASQIAADELRSGR